MKILKSIYYSLIAAADSRVDWWERIHIALLWFISLAPVAFLLELFKGWFSENSKFVAFFVIVLTFNMGIGIWKHLAKRTFRWEIFIMKTSQMLVAVLSIYFLLFIMADTANDNIVADSFKVLIQIMTLFYPASKAIKNIHIMTNGEYPPKWLMDKVYNFEKNGDLNDLFKKEDDELN